MNEQEKEIFRLLFVRSQKDKDFHAHTQGHHGRQTQCQNGRPAANAHNHGVSGLRKTSRAKASGENFVRLGKDDMLAYHPNLFKLNQLAPVRLNSKEPDCYDAAQITNQDGERESLVEKFAEEAFWVALDFCRNQRYNVIVDGLPSEEMIDIAEDAKEQGLCGGFCCSGHAQAPVGTEHCHPL